MRPRRQPIFRANTLLPDRPDTATPAPRSSLTLCRKVVWPAVSHFVPEDFAFKYIDYWRSETIFQQGVNVKNQVLSCNMIR